MRAGPGAPAGSVLLSIAFCSFCSCIARRRAAPAAGSGEWLCAGLYPFQAEAASGICAGPGSGPISHHSRPSSLKSSQTPVPGPVPGWVMTCPGRGQPALEERGIDRVLSRP